MAPESPEARRQLLAGLHALRSGKIGAALEAWDAAIAADPACSDALAFRDYVKKNRIRIAVHLGRMPPPEDGPIELPSNWPPPPPGLCDPPPPDNKIEKAEAPAPQSTATAAADAEPDDEPYATLEIGGDEDPASAAQNAAPGGGSNEYAVLEIVVEDEDDPIEVSGALPPPPEAMDAPEIILEAPREERAPVEAPGDYVMDRANQEALDGLGLERLAGPVAPGARPTPPASPSSNQASPGAGSYAEDAPTIARDPEASPPRAFPGQAEPSSPPGAAAHDTLDRFPSSQEVAPPRPPPGATPHGTLMGVGLSNPFAAGVVPNFGPGLPPGVAPGTGGPIPSFTPVGAPPPEPSGEDGPTIARAPAGASPPEDFSTAEGSFAEDIPTRMRSRQDSGPMGRAMIRPMPLDDAGDYASSEGSFSDDIPTQARSMPPSPAPRAQAPAKDPGDYVGRESSFSDDMPTQAREGLRGARPGVRPMPLSGELSGERSFSEEQVTLERKSQRQASTNDEIEALLDPERGLALARQLYTDKSFERSLQVVERLSARYGKLPGCDELLEQNQRALEVALLVELGPLNAIAAPRSPTENLSDLDLDPRAAFLFTRIDGTLTLEDLLDISGMSRFETARILLKLRDLGLLVFEPGR